VAANSSYIARRIEKHFRRSSTVIYSQVELPREAVGNENDGYYLTVSRLEYPKRGGSAGERLHHPGTASGSGGHG